MARQCKQCEDYIHNIQLLEIEIKRLKKEIKLYQHWISDGGNTEEEE